MIHADLIPTAKLSQEDVLLALLVTTMIAAWEREGKRERLSGYWRERKPYNKNEIVRGFMVLAQYSVTQGPRSIDPALRHLSGVVIETRVSAGEIEFQPAFRHVGLKPRDERYIL